MSEQTERIESMRTISPGWMGGGGESISEVAIERAKIFSQVLSASEPGVFPMENGGITFEWSNSVGHVSIDFYPEEERSPELLHGEVFVMADRER